MSVRLASVVCGIMLALMANDTVSAQQAASVSGTYCATWRSGNYWRMTLRQNGTNVSASVTGRRPDGVPTSGTGSGSISGSQISIGVTFSRGATGTFSGTFSGRSISASFSRGSGDSAHFVRC
jgi:hypothetical protein